MFIKIVKFKDGKYSVRRWTIFGFEYLDIEHGNYWWRITINQITCYRGTLIQVEAALQKWKDRNGKVYKNV